ncbi:hypothetical protein PCE1_004317 [Barthelona sp. PCE]
MNVADATAEYDFLGNQLVSTSCLGAAKKYFNFTYFNSIQSACYNTLLYCNDNMVISSPTATGKTTLFELAIIKNMDQQKSNKTIYISPLKALCYEVYQNWKQKFNGLNVMLLTSDKDKITQTDVQQSDIFITTPEKLDSLTRHETSYSAFKLSDMKLGLVCIDEIHILGDRRGAILEILVTRMKMRRVQPRFIAVSATIPNIQDVGLWLNCSSSNILHFGKEHRPVKLTHVVHSAQMRDEDNIFQFNNFLRYRVPNIVEKYSNGSPTLIFCSVRKETTSLANFLMEKLSRNGLDRPTLNRIASDINDVSLADLVRSGIAFHHGGLNYQTRSVIEDAFRQGKIKVLCATSTLAVGINMPAHLVIIKGTWKYDSHSGQYVPLSYLEIEQMCGRAGRPQYDQSATAVIMTSDRLAPQYERMSLGRQPIESHLLDQSISTFINAEIDNNYIKHVQDALDWISSSYLYVRMQTNPYSLHTINKPEKKVDLIEVVHEALSKLEKIDAIVIDDGTILPTKLSNIISRHKLDVEYVSVAIQKFEKEIVQTTLNVPAAMKSKVSLDAVYSALQLYTESQEFELRFNLRRRQKSILNKLNGGRNKRKKDRNESTIRHPYPGPVTTTSTKIAVLLQAMFDEKLRYVDHDLKQQAIALQRLLSGYYIGLCKTVIYMFQKRRDFTNMNHILALIRATQSINGRIWFDEHAVLLQFDGIGSQKARTLSQSGISTIQQLRDHVTRSLIQKISGFGPSIVNKLGVQLSSVPQLTVDVSASSSCDIIIKVTKERHVPPQLHRSNIQKYTYNGCVVASIGAHVITLQHILLTPRGQSFTVSVPLAAAVKHATMDDKWDSDTVVVDIGVYILEVLGIDVHIQHIQTIEGVEHVSRSTIPRPVLIESDSDFELSPTIPNLKINASGLTFSTDSEDETSVHVEPPKQIHEEKNVKNVPSKKKKVKQYKLTDLPIVKKGSRDYPIHRGPGETSPFEKRKAKKIKKKVREKLVDLSKYKFQQQPTVQDQTPMENVSTIPITVTHSAHTSHQRTDVLLPQRTVQPTSLWHFGSQYEQQPSQHAPMYQQDFVYDAPQQHFQFNHMFHNNATYNHSNYQQHNPHSQPHIQPQPQMRFTFPAATTPVRSKVSFPSQVLQVAHPANYQMQMPQHHHHQLAPIPVQYMPINHHQFDHQQNHHQSFNCTTDMSLVDDKRARSLLSINQAQISQKSMPTHHQQYQNSAIMTL